MLRAREAGLSPLVPWMFAHGVHVYLYTLAASPSLAESLTP